MDRRASISTLTRRSVDFPLRAHAEADSPGELRYGVVVPSPADPSLLRLSEGCDRSLLARHNALREAQLRALRPEQRVASRGTADEGEDEDESEGGQQQRGATIAVSVSNLVNTMLGAGMLGMSYMFSHAGMALGPVLVTVFALLALFGTRLLYDCADKVVREQLGSSKPTFYSLAALVLSYVGTMSGSHAEARTQALPRSGRVVDGAVFTMCFCTLVAYLMILGDLIPSTVAFVATDAWPAFLLSKSFWLPVAMAPLALVCFFKRLDSMLWGSVVVLVSVVYLVLLVVVFASYNGWRSGSRPPVRAVPYSLEFFGVMPMAVFGFSCHTNVLTVYNEFSSDNGRRSWISSSIAFLVSAIVYIVIGALGYTTFGALVSPNLINSSHSVPIAIGRLFTVLLVGFSYPVMLHPARSSMDRIVFASLPHWRPTIRHVGETVALLVATFVLAFFIKSLDVVIEFCGSTGSTLVSFVLPGAFYVRLFASDGWCFRRACAAALALWGVMFGVWSVILLFLGPAILG
eukprot:m51a1_g14538 hypothetical protein (519) ;mRNA; r:951657-953528